jgi:hypothetical protein
MKIENSYEFDINSHFKPFPSFPPGFLDFPMAPPSLGGVVCGSESYNPGRNGEGHRPGSTARAVHVEPGRGLGKGWSSLHIPTVYGSRGLKQHETTRVGIPIFVPLIHWTSLNYNSITWII